MRGIITVAVLITVGAIVAIVAWATLITIDVNNDWATRDHEPQKYDTHRGLGRALYRWLWNRKVDRAELLERRRIEAGIRWGRGRR